jgi:DNA-binding response OmpR family regulator
VTPLILLVTDIPDHLPRYEAALRENGYAAAVSLSSADAVVQAIAEPPVCIVIDERVSTMDGWELCRRLRSDLRLRSIPVVMLVQNLSLDTAMQGQRSGCRSWLARPTTGEQLVHAIQHVLSLEQSAPANDADAAIGTRSCAACRSEQIRAALRIGPVQYYFCRACGFYWDDARVSFSAS